MIFEYNAYNTDGQLVSGELDASGRGDALNHLLKRNLKPINVNEKRERRGILSISIFDSIDTTDILFVVRNIATSLRVGMSAVESVEMVARDAEKESVRIMLRNVLASLKTGSTFAKAFAPHAKHFPQMFIGMVEAGEASGNLEGTLLLFADYLDKAHALRSRVRTALIYPIILVITSILVSILILVVMVPKLANIFTDARLVLPWITRAMIAVSNVFTYSYTLDVVGFVVLVSVIFVSLRTQGGKRSLSYIGLHVPGIKEIVRKTAIVRISRTLGTLLSSGVGILDSIRLAGASSGNEYYMRAMSRVGKRIEGGESLALAMDTERSMFSNAFVGIVSVGERTGHLSDALSSVADFYERDVDARLKNISSIIEPLLILLMGVVVGGIALSVLLPIYQLVGSVR